MVIVVVIDAEEDADRIPGLGRIDHRPSFIGPKTSSRGDDSQREADERDCAYRHPPQDLVASGPFPHHRRPSTAILKRP